MRSSSFSRSRWVAGRNARLHTLFIFFRTRLSCTRFWFLIKSFLTCVVGQRKDMVYECQCLTTDSNPCSVFLPPGGGQEERGLAQVSRRWVAKHTRDWESPALCPELPYSITLFLYTSQQFPRRWKLLTALSRPEALLLELVLVPFILNLRGIKLGFVFNFSDSSCHIFGSCCLSQSEGTS